MSNPIEQFWSDAAQASLVILTDFDFTISHVDVGDLVTDRLAPPSPATVLRFGRGEIGTRLYWLDSIVRADLGQAAALADTVSIDPGFAPFAAWCRAESIPLAVVSDGFRFYIERILGREGLSDLPIFCNEMVAAGTLQFPHGNAACDICGCCKAQVARRVRETGARVIYIGDGVSDLYGAGFADWVFGKARLERYLQEHRSPYYPLTGFDAVLQTLQANLTSFRAGTAPHRATLGPNPRCRFL